MIGIDLRILHAFTYLSEARARMPLNSVTNPAICIGPISVPISIEM